MAQNLQVRSATYAWSLSAYRATRIYLSLLSLMNRQPALRKFMQYCLIFMIFIWWHRRQQFIPRQRRIACYNELEISPTPGNTYKEALMTARLDYTTTIIRARCTVLIPHDAAFITPLMHEIIFAISDIISQRNYILWPRPFIGVGRAPIIEPEDAIRRALSCKMQGNPEDSHAVIEQCAALIEIPHDAIHCWHRIRGGSR